MVLWPLLRKVHELCSLVVSFIWRLRTAIAGPEDIKVQQIQKGGPSPFGWEGKLTVPCSEWQKDHFNFARGWTVVRSSSS